MTNLFSHLHDEYAERMTAQAFDALFRRVFKPGQFCPEVARVLSKPAPWEDTCDTTSTPEDR
jgi:hypothetical protein